MLSEVALKVQLEIPAERIMHHLVLHNETIEGQVKEGVERAVKELTSGDVLVEGVKNRVMEAILDSFSRGFRSWNMESIINEMLYKKVHDQVSVMVEEISKSLKEKLTK